LATNRRELAYEGLKMAVRVGQAHRIRIEDPVSVYDFSEELNLEVRFVDIPSMEGMYLRKSPPEILVSSHRPPGRQSYTCAHEIGHHLFNHGTHIDEISQKLSVGKKFDPEEFLADTFAGFLLMPKTAVRSAFVRRGWRPESCSPDQAYRIACWLGVGYSTLIHHMQVSFNLILRPHAEKLSRETPKSIRRDLIRGEIEGNLIPVDFFWTGRPIDIRIGDVILLPPFTKYEGKSLTRVCADDGPTLLKGNGVGIARLSNDNSSWSCFVRVSRKEYIGLSRYRHLEEPDDD
jgi:hypothetical protein